VQQDYAGDAVELVLDAALTSQLKALSQRHGVTLYMTLLASWAAVLARLSNQTEVVIGSPVAGRNRAEIEPLIGFFVNTLALRIDLGGEATVAQLLAQTRQRVLEAQAHQDLPFDQVVEAMKPPRSTAHTPIFQVMFAFNNHKTKDLEMSGIDVTPVISAGKTEQFDLSLDIFESDGTLSGSLGYAKALFDHATAERYLGYWKHVLLAMVVAEDKPVMRLKMLGEEERRRLLVDWNDTARGYPQEQCIHELFEAQVERTPSACALIFADTTMTYAQLNRRANQLANHLRMLGVAPERKVAICADRSMEMMVAVLATLKAGGAYIALDPSSPPERIAYTLDNSTPVVVLVHGLGDSVVRGCGFVDRPLLNLHFDAHLWQDQGTENSSSERTGLTPQNLAYVIYTSGTTGVPNGVMVEHRSVLARIEYAISSYAMTAHDRCLQFASLGFDASVIQMFPGLCVGAALVIRGQDLLTPKDLVKLIRKHRITIADVPPSYLDEILAQGAQSELKNLRVLITGGEATLAETIRGQSFHYRLLNEYGPTEASVVATCFEMHAGTPIDNRAVYVPIGRPIDNTTVYLLDERLQPVPTGTVGEIYIGGVGVARGYLGSPELTAKRFITDRFTDTPEARLYRTGDLGRWSPEGNIIFLGRNDFQVKIRGFRIELGEIEAKLASLEGVREALVLVREDEPGVKRLVAYYLSDGSLTIERIRERLSKQLPDYMVPSAFVPMEAWKLTPNGKVDRSALAGPEGDAYARREYEAPVGKLEKALAAIWSELLKIDRVSRHDNFFELGGQSLLAIRLISELQSRTGLQMQAHEIFKAQTIAAQAQRLEPSLRDTTSCLVPIKPQGEGAPLFLIHPVGGDVMCYLPLVRASGLQCPVFAFQREELASGGEIVFRSIEDMASDYRDMIREVQPHGPYSLAGWSMGGVIASCIAEHLENEGEHVIYLGLIDSSLHMNDDFGDSDAMAGGSGQEVFERLVSQVEHDAEDRDRFDREMRLEAFAETLDAKAMRRIRRINLAGVVAASRFNCDLSVSSLRYYGAATPGGEELAEKVAHANAIARDTVHARMFEGDHYTIMQTPRVKALAETIAADVAMARSPTERTAAAPTG
jgi:amino acid adenylation domain-containing protein